MNFIAPCLFGDKNITIVAVALTVKIIVWRQVSFSLKKCKINVLTFFGWYLLLTWQFQMFVITEISKQSITVELLFQQKKKKICTFDRAEHNNL